MSSWRRWRRDNVAKTTSMKRWWCRRRQNDVIGVLMMSTSLQHR